MGFIKAESADIGRRVGCVGLAISTTIKFPPDPADAGSRMHRCFSDSIVHVENDRAVGGTPIDGRERSSSRRIGPCTILDWDF